MEPIKQFDRLSLSLDNVIIPVDRLLNTPSQKDGMSHELEVDLRITGCEYIQSAGLLLKLPQVSVSVGVVYFLTGRHGNCTNSISSVLLCQVICKV